MSDETPWPDGPPLADTSDMFAIHKVFRDAIDARNDLISADAANAGIVAGYYADVLELLRVHHEGEDELVWPVLTERLPQHAQEIERIANQHEALHDLLPAAVVTVQAWATDANPATAAEATAALGRLGDELYPHLDEEEQVIVPLAATVMTAPEWGELPAHGMAAYSGDRLWLILGLVRDEMTQEQRDVMLENMPPEAAAFWTSTGEDLYRDFMSQLR